MNSCCFLNHVLYPSSYYESYAVVAVLYGSPGTVKTPYPQFTDDGDTTHLNPLIAALDAIRLDAELDEALVARGIEFSNPVHFVHYMGKSQLLHMLRVYAEAEYPGSFHESHTYAGTPITELSTYQLRKLVLLVYERDFYGVLAGLDG